jgi:hypothetical protein
MNLASRAWGLICRLAGIETGVWGRSLALATVVASSGSAMAQTGACCTSGACATTTQAACISPSTWTSQACTPNPCQTTGPDIIVCNFTDLSNGPTYNQPSNNVITINNILYDQFAVGTTSANKGNQQINWYINSGDNRHPAISEGIYRYIPSLNRFEQLGVGSVKHGFEALQQSDCAYPNYFAFACVNSNNGGVTLGTGCADPYCCGLNYAPGNMGPRYEINAATGLFPYPNSTTYVANSGPPKARISDLQAAPTGTRYVMEAQYIVGDDAGFHNNNNNASWQEVLMTPTAPAPSSTNFQAALTGSIHREQAAIYAWQAFDNTVAIQTFDVPNDGRFILASKVTGPVGGLYTYEYALHNLNSNRCAGSFIVPLPGAQNALGSIGFHDVDVQGEPNASPTTTTADDWGVSGGNANDTTVSWSGPTWGGTQGTYTMSSTPYKVLSFTPGTGADVTANVIRWGTMFNFRFTSEIAPGSGGSVAVGLFRPGTGTSFLFTNVQTPGGATVGNLTATCCTGTVCSVAAQSACSGTWGLPGTTCSPDPCVIGVCCDTGNCSMTTHPNCGGFGVWSASGTCTPNTCPAPTGACCPGSSCVISTQAACATGYQGNNTTCSGGPCPPANDTCANAIWLADNVPYTGTNTNALTDFNGNNLANCSTGTNSGADVWFKYKPAVTGSVRVTTNTVSGVGSTAIDTVLSVHASCGATTSIACNDDSGSPANSSNIAAVTLTAGTTYLIRVAGYNSATGTYTVRVIGGGGTIPTGACCAADGTCTAVAQTACSTTYQGDATVCNPNPCPPPSGSCCAPSGACSTGIQSACSGAWTSGGSCSPNICPVPSGVCCRGATCSISMTDSSSCAGSVGAGSTTSGVWSTTSGVCNAAGNSTSPCCYADYNKTGGISVQDIFDFLNDWFAGFKYTVVGGDGVHGTLSVQNIFDFLGVWFAGGC